MRKINKEFNKGRNTSPEHWKLKGKSNNRVDGGEDRRGELDSVQEQNNPTRTEIKVVV